MWKQRQVVGVGKGQGWSGWKRGAGERHLPGLAADGRADGWAPPGLREQGRSSGQRPRRGGVRQ